MSTSSKAATDLASSLKIAEQRLRDEILDFYRVVSARCLKPLRCRRLFNDGKGSTEGASVKSFGSAAYARYTEELWGEQSPSHDVLLLPDGRVLIGTRARPMTGKYADRLLLSGDVKGASRLLPLGTRPTPVSSCAFPLKNDSWKQQTSLADELAKVVAFLAQAQ